MLRDMLSYVGLQGLVGDEEGPSILDGRQITSSSGAQDNGNSSSGAPFTSSSFSSCGRSVSCAPPHIQKLLQQHQARGGPSIRLVIRGARRTGKSSLLSRMQGGGSEKWSSTYYPTQAIQPGVFLWRPRQVSVAAQPTSTSMEADGAAPLPTRGQSSSSAGLCETRVELWDVVDRGTPNPVLSSSNSDPKTAGERCQQHSLQHLTSSAASVMMPTDASTIDVYRGAHGVVFLYDATSRDTFDHVLEALPRVPRHLPIAVCGNFWDLVHEDKERLEVDEKDVEKLLKLVAHRAVTPLFASFLAAANRSNQSTGGGAHHSLPPPPALSSFVVDPVHIQLSVKDGFGLTPLHRFTGVCAAFAKAVELDASIQHAYGRVASAAEDLNALNEDQKYEEFLQWKADAEERKQKQYLMFEENQRRRQQQQHDTTGRDEELQISSSPLPDSDEDNRSTTRSKKSQPQSLRSAGRAKRGSAAAAAAVRQAEREGGVAQSKDNRATNKPQLQSQSQPATSASASASAVTLASMTFGDAIAPSFFDGADFDEPPRPLSSAPDNNNKSRNRKHSSSDDDDEDHNSLRTNEHVVAATTTTTSGATAPPLKAVNARIAATAVRMATNERKARIMEQLAAQNIDVACSTVSPPTANGVVGKRNGSSNASFPSTSTSLSPQQIIDATIVSALTQSFEDNFAAAAAAAAVENDVPSGDEQVGVAVDVVIERTRYERNSGGEVAAQSAGRGSGYGSHS
ncbi:GTP-binding protein (Parf), putative [Bodo saltans]|uniref:GTP-binding protein (Parf), putative n=1 Tax=Bodo saltans TaxID=75058 RepID=A0A0S4INT2_BODSA|nr:GTP-binding protein (Parf), putative [Bodo saltans]|eukprot:CUE94914.1 GTP-binding protein (Parf), putative [Bodo saltans]